MNKKIGKRYLTGFFWSFLGNIFWRILSVVTTILITRLLGPKQFGALSMVRSTVNLFADYAGFRLGSTANRHVALYRNKETDKAARILKLSLFVGFNTCFIVSLIYIAFSGYLADSVFGDKSYTIVLIISAVFMFFHIYGNILEAALAGFENFKSIAKIVIIRGILTPCLCLPAVYFFNLEGYFIALTLISSIILIKLIKAVNLEKQKFNFPVSIPFKSLKNEVSVLWTFALPGFIGGLTISFLWWYGSLLVTQGNDGYVELGHFAAANQWRSLIMFLPAILARVALPILSETHASNANDFLSAITIQFKSYCMIIMPLTVLVIAFSKLLAGLFGKDYAGTEEIIPILMLSVFFDILSQSMRNIFDSAGRRWTNIFIHFASFFIYLASCHILIPFSGAIGFSFSLYIFFGTLFLFQLIVADISISPSLIRRVGGLFLYSQIIVTTCYLIKTNLQQYYANLFFVLLLTLGSIPALFRVKNYLTYIKNK